MLVCVSHLLLWNTTDTSSYKGKIDKKACHNNIIYLYNSENKHYLEVKVKIKGDEQASSTERQKTRDMREIRFFCLKSLPIT